MTIVNIEERLKKLKREDFFSKANLHIHSTCSDGKLHPEEIVEQAKDLELFSITDHNSVEAYKVLDYKNIPNLITGVEFDCWHNGVLVHILGYGIDIKNTEILDLCKKISSKSTLKRFFNTIKAIDTITVIKKAGGLAVLAHPCCYWAWDLMVLTKSLKCLDGIESYYPYRRHRKIIKFHPETKVTEIANQLNLLKTGGTDCHGEVFG